MASVTVDVVVKDPEVADFKGISPFERFTVDREEFLLDGPVSERVAVLDFQEDGTLAPGVPYEPPAQGAGEGRYRLERPRDLASPEVACVSVFGTVLKTMYMFEEPDALGRRLRWAFDGPQLLVVPRAGEWANAFYERASRSLQFFYFPSRQGAGVRVYTSHSQDIVAHETAHAILDGIAPDLYHALSPQSLALHESVADLTTLLMAFRSRELRDRVLEQTGGSIEHSSAFTGLAEQFATALGPDRHFLRDLKNDRRLDPEDAGLRSDPHALSEVLSGALYGVMVRLHEALKDEYARSRATPGLLEAAELAGLEQASPDVAADYRMRQRPRGLTLEEARRRAAHKALWVGAQRFKRTLLRALDYLPPGEVSFADFGRAILACDQASHPDSELQRTWIRHELAARGVVAHEDDLVVATNYYHPAVERLDLEALVESDWVAYGFANRNRRLLGIPRGIPFEVRPRVDVTKTYYHRDGPRTERECLLKVSWTLQEPNRAGWGLPRQRRRRAGTTLAIDWATRQVRALLTSDPSEDRRVDRDLMLRRLAEEGLLRSGAEAVGPDGRPLRAVIPFDTRGGAMRVRGTARMLHIVGERRRG